MAIVRAAFKPLPRLPAGPGCVTPAGPECYRARIAASGVVLTGRFRLRRVRRE